MALTLEVAYGDAAALAHDVASQLAQGGLYVAVDAAALPPLAPLTLRLVLGDAAFTAPARLTVATAEAACVELEPAGREALLQALAAHLGTTAGRAGERQARVYDADAQRDDAREPHAHGATARRDDAREPHAHGATAPRGDGHEGHAHGATAQFHGATAQPDGDGDGDARGVIPLDRRIAVMSVNEKIQLALHGNRDARALLIRDRAGVVQASLARNPKITLDEVQALARSPQLAPDAAESLAQHPSWGGAAGVVLALVRNPRTPLPTATALVSKLIPSDLRVIAKGLGVRPQVAQAARKLMFEPER